jgi:hypothetical protein
LSLGEIRGQHTKFEGFSLFQDLSRVSDLVSGVQMQAPYLSAAFAWVGFVNIQR